MNEIGIKFICNWIKSKPLDAKWIKDLNAWREKLHKLNLIGAYDNGIGYGNISTRFEEKQFIITGAATGKYNKLTTEHYTLVTDYNFDKNELTTVGPIRASSESLTHAAIYECDTRINAVIHIHNSEMWKKLLNIVPATNQKIEYGTIEMAKEIGRLFKSTGIAEKKIFVMAGHEDGIVSFGKNLDEAGKKILSEFGV